MNGVRITGLILLLGGLLIANGWLGKSVIGARKSTRGLGELTRFDSSSTPAVDLIRTTELHRQRGLEVISGEVFVVEPVALQTGRSRAFQLMVETNDGVISAYLGPRWMVDSGSLQLRPGDVVRMLGLRTAVSGHDLFMVAEIQNGARQLRIVEPSALLLWKKMNDAGLTPALYAASN